MTETDPAPTPHEPTAGEVGVHRQDMTEPVTDVGDSRNVAPQRGRAATTASPGAAPSADSTDDDANRSEGTREEQKPEMERAEVEPSHDGTYEEEAGMKRTDNSGTTGQVDEVDEVRRDIAQTRDELGDTVDAIAAKADVRTRARERVEGVRTMTKEKAAEMAGRVREAPGTVKEAADKVAVRVREATPEPVKDAADKVAQQSRRHPAVTAATAMTAAIAAVGLLILRRLLRRRRS
jgi:hypothetical protein